jgi:hypothetical protein
MGVGEREQNRKHVMGREMLKLRNATLTEGSEDN